MPSEAQSTIDDDDYFGLMDIVVVIAEWWIYILSAAIISGCIAFWFISAREPTFATFAIVDVSDVNEELILSPAVADRIVERAGLASRQEFGRLYSINNTNQQAAQIEVVSDSAERSLEITNVVLDELASVSQPSDAQRALLDARIERLRASIERSEQARDALIEPNQGSGPQFNAGQTAEAIVSLSTDIDERMELLRIEERKLSGFGQMQIMRSPTTVTVPPSGGSKILVMAVAGAAFFIIAIGIARELWLRARRDPINRPKTDRIREAFFRS
ncbi:MAG: hypothetical protein IBJ07_06535 [Rhizobiaceae bacterium]|nr:hypothetical protein [Rhizobiaceae bacterium]